MTNRKRPLYCLLLAILFLSLACNLPRPAEPSATEEATETAASSVEITNQPDETPAVLATDAVESPEAIPTDEMETPIAPAAELTGLKVVYTKDGNLWLWAGESALPLTSSGEVFMPCLSPDGEIVAFLRPVDDFHTELWAIDTDGTDERRLVSVADLDKIGGGVRDPSAAAVNPYSFEWQPGSHTLAFNTYQVFQGPGHALLDDLNLVDADTLEITNLLLAGWGGEFTYSPDGSQVALSTPSAILLADADGGNYRQVLAYQPVITYSEYRYYAKPLWSPDGMFLRVAIPPVDPLALPAQPTSLWKIPTDGSPPVQEGSLTAVPFFEEPPTYSPDLSRLAYLVEAGQPAENLRQLQLATYDGAGGWTYYKAAMLHFAGWSPDSRSFVFIKGEDQQAWLGSLDAAAETLPGDLNGVSRFTWVDASYYLYLMEKAGIFDFYLASLDGEATLIDTLPQPPDFDFTYSSSD